MKKIKKIAVATLFCAAIFTGYTAYKETTMTDQERLFRANLEALTDDEDVSAPGWIATYKNAFGDDLMCCAKLEASFCNGYLACSDYGLSNDYPSDN